MLFPFAECNQMTRGSSLHMLDICYMGNFTLFVHLNKQQYSSTLEVTYIGGNLRQPWTVMVSSSQGKVTSLCNHSKRWQDGLQPWHEIYILLWILYFILETLLFNMTEAVRQLSSKIKGKTAIFWITGHIFYSILEILGGIQSMYWLVPLLRIWSYSVI